MKFASELYGCDVFDFTYEKDLITKLSELNEQMYKGSDDLDQIVKEVKGEIVEKDAQLIKTAVLEKMAELRNACDQAEKLCAKDYWPMPDYGDLLFSID